MSYLYCNFYLNDDLLFVSEPGFLPPEGTLVDYHDAETDTITRYRVNDVILEVDELSAVPPIPLETSGSLRTHTSSWRLEISVVP